MANSDEAKYPYFNTMANKEPQLPYTSEEAAKQAEVGSFISSAARLLARGDTGAKEVMYAMQQKEYVHRDSMNSGGVSRLINALYEYNEKGGKATFSNPSTAIVTLSVYEYLLTAIIERAVAPEVPSRKTQLYLMASALQSCDTNALGYLGLDVNNIASSGLMHACAVTGIWDLFGHHFKDEVFG